MLLRGTRDASVANMDPAGTFTFQVEQVDGFDFRVKFDKEQYPELRMDEPAPLGKDTAPNPARILAASVGNCLSASLVFCLQRKGVTVKGLRSEVKVELIRNDRKRLRIGHIEVTIHPGSDIPKDVLDACLSTFEDFCVVTQSVREGLDVKVNVSTV
ncbi:MAG: OsmC family protein [Polyangiaceae bacterium]|nr:OsmC family protein [Polyangiaceae bacterium]